MGSRPRFGFTRSTSRSGSAVRTLGLALGGLAMLAGASSAATMIEQRAAALGLARYTVQSVAVTELGSERMARITLEGVPVTLRLEPMSLRAPGFRVRVQDANGEHDVPAPPSFTYRGTVDELPGATVGGVVRDGRLSVVILPPESKPYFVEPVGGVDGDPAEHFVYRGDDVAPQGGTCAANGPAQPVSPPGEAAFAPAQTLRLAEVAFDTDYEFYQKNGSNVDQTVQDIEYVMSGVNTVYQRDVQVWNSILSVIVRTVPGAPYTSSNADTLLIQLSQEWAAHQFSTPRDFVHLMTGKNIIGSVIGLAVIGGVCNKSKGYGLSESRFTTNFNYRLSLTSHEMGHQFNAVHCDASDTCNIMCSIIAGCDGLGLPNFESRGLNYIRNFAASRVCLTDVQTGVEGRAASSGVRLEAARPTPFGRRTELRFYLERGGPARLAVYDVSGRRVAVLVDGNLPAGWHEATWDGRGTSGGRLEPGVFMARLEMDGVITMRRMVFLK